jgi:hypothetical protein
LLEKTNNSRLLNRFNKKCQANKNYGKSVAPNTEIVVGLAK